MIMVLVIERTGSLVDLRRTQKRVAALILSGKHQKLQKFKLRRSTLHQSMCHVCSRVDPDGIFRIPNGHLYKKGFFKSLDDVNHELQTTVVHVQEDHPKTDCKDDTSFNDSEEKQPEKISVTIRRGSKSTIRPSTLKQETSRQSFCSRMSNYKQPVKDMLMQREISDCTSKVSLPQITQNTGSRFSYDSLDTTKKSSVARTPSIELTWLSRKSPFTPDAFSPGRITDLPSYGDRITVIPTSFDDRSVVSGLSTFHEGTTPSKSSNDLDSKFASEERSLQSKHSFMTLQSYDSPATKPTRRSVTPGKEQSESTLRGKISRTTNSERRASASGQATEGDIVTDNKAYAQNCLFQPQPLIREKTMLPEQREILKRPKAGHQRERFLHLAKNRSASTIPTKSGHQSDGDQSIGNQYDKHSADLEHDLERVKTEMGNYSESVTSKDISVDTTIIFSEKSFGLRNQQSQKNSVCRCSATLMDERSSENLCRNCGKVYLLDSQMAKSGISQQVYNSQAESDSRASTSTRCLSTRQQMLEHNVTLFNRSKTVIENDQVARVNMSSRTSTDESKMTRLKTRSKTSLDDDILNRTNITSQTSSENNYISRMNIRSKPIIDEDYMDLDSIIYWSSGDESMSPSSWYRHAHPFPSVDPDIHKTVYLRALKAARLQTSKRKLENIDEMIRRPNVFSYIPLLPVKDKVHSEDLGLRQYQSSKPKKGQFMKHIFGEVRLDDFYVEVMNKNKNSDVIGDCLSSETDVDKNV